MESFDLAKVMKIYCMYHENNFNEVFSAVGILGFYCPAGFVC